VAILVNPKAGARAAGPWAESLAMRLRDEGFFAELFDDLDLAASRANQWYAEGSLRALVAAGGDGTAAELVNRTVEGVPLALLPAGNSNLLARYFRLKKDPDAIGRVVIDGVTACVDAGVANGRIFLLMASSGVHAEVVRRVHARRTGHVRYQSYLKPIAETIWRYDFPAIRVHWEHEGDAGWPESVRWLFAFNLPCYGGGFRIAPQADGSDGLLDACGYRWGGFWPGIGLAAATLLGQHQRLPGWTTRHTRRLRATSDTPVPYQLDGDPGGVLPVEIESLPGRLTLVVPRETVTVCSGC